MSRSTKASWLNSPGDLAEADVEDVPTPGETVRVRALSAAYSAEVQGQLRMVTEGGSQVARIDVAAMERLQFLHGVIDPEFTLEEVTQIQRMFGRAFKKVIAKIDELSGIDKEAIENTEQRFPVGGTSEDGGPSVPDGNGVAAGVRGPDVPA